MPKTFQRAFAGAWAAAVAEADARHQADRDAAGQLVEEARDEAAQADTEAARATKAEEQVGRLEQRLTDQEARHEQERQAAATALAAEQASAREAREALAEARGRLAVLQEQAALYWNKKDAQPGQGAGA